MHSRALYSEYSIFGPYIHSSSFQYHHFGLRNNASKFEERRWSIDTARITTKCWNILSTSNVRVGTSVFVNLSSYHMHRSGDDEITLTLDSPASRDEAYNIPMARAQFEFIATVSYMFIFVGKGRMIVYRNMDTWQFMKMTLWPLLTR